MKIFWKVIVAVIAFSLLGIMIVLGTAYIKSVERHTYLADLNEQADARCSLIIEQMKEAEGVNEALKADNQMLWVQSMNSIRNRAEEIIKQELIYC